MNIRVLVSILLITSSLNLPACAGEFRIKDGDSFILPSGEEVRLWGIDAPEFYQVCMRDTLPYSCGEEARLELIEIIGRDKILCRKKATDKYGRSISRCSVRGNDLGAMMVRSGYALDYDYFSDGYYSKEQNAAQSENKGLWSGQFEKPWIWRKKHK